jgi:hypothetical protein
MGHDATAKDARTLMDESRRFPIRMRFGALGGDDPQPPVVRNFRRDHIAKTAGVGKSAWFKDPDGNTNAIFQAE